MVGYVIHGGDDMRAARAVPEECLTFLLRVANPAGRGLN